MDYKEQLVINVLDKMGKHISQEQFMILNQVLLSELKELNIEKKNNGLITYDQSATKILQYFLISKKASGCQESTLKSYKHHLQKFIDNIRTPLLSITTDDIRWYLIAYKEQNKVSNVTLNNARLSLSTFFSWLRDEGMIKENPMRRIKRIKTKKVIKKAFTDEEIERLRMSCMRERDRAIVEFLYSTGVRVSEMVSLNIDQVDFVCQECIVMGKGAKERTVYLNAKACMYLKNYLNSRNDSNSALFVQLKKPYDRLSKGGVEAFVRKLGEKAGVDDTYPHRFRRTMATNALNKGMPLEEVKELMGHVKSDTTLIYSTANKENIKLSHKKYIA